MARLSQPTQTAAPKATSQPSKSSNSRNQRVMRVLSIGEKVPPISPLPFSSLSSPDLIELMHKKPRIGSDYKRRYDPYVQPYVDTTFNVVRAALMRKSRIEAKKYVQLKKLDGFLKLPLDIILSTLEYLHPIDIYHLSRSSFIFRDLLKDQMPLLTRIYQANGVPVWPPEISYDHWADLLFGDAICDRCQVFVALPDFVHRQRICSECFQLGFQFTHRSMGAAIVPKGFRDS
ncbi:hypothetical protein BDN72DRAFT_843589 [Pluteus cervinus]|uniref:Uncharacterized protein n=1 Tax=Pluteus cervinus TaxID=181527 RepID=A0ACD3AM12_9AGAR|nr:hypothetical protein BDN72DRAFT_843589 [Pluteus cervinus]